MIISQMHYYNTKIHLYVVPKTRSDLLIFVLPFDAFF